MSDTKFSIGVFNPQNVNSYLEGQNSKVIQKEISYVDKLDTVRAEQEEFVSKCSSYEKEIHELKMTLNREHLNYLYELNEKEKLKQKLDEVKNGRPVLQNNDSEVLEKARKYDASKQIIARTLLQAQKDSKIMLENARITSEKMLSEVYLNISVIKNHTDAYKNIYEAISRDLMNLTKNFNLLDDIITLINNEMSKFNLSVLNSKSSLSQQEEAEELDLDKFLEENVMKDESYKQVQVLFTEKNINEPKAETPAAVTNDNERKVSITDILKKYSNK